MKPLLAIAALLSGLLISNSITAQVPADAVWIDVRTAEEFADGHLQGAHNIPHESIEAGVAAMGLEPGTPIYLYCRSGRRSGLATEALAKKGYTNVTNARNMETARLLINRLAD